MSKHLKQTLFHTLVLSFVALSIQACSGNSKQAPSAAPGPEPEATGLSSIDGNWTTGCVLQNGAASNEQRTFTKGAFTIAGEVYMGATCDGSPIITFTSKGTYSVSGTAANPVGAVNIDVTVTEGDQAQPGTYYTIALIEGGKLYFADVTTSSPNARPTDVNRTRPFSKIE